MRTVYSKDHERQHGTAELNEGRMMPVVEMPRRAHTILARVREVGLGAIDAPTDHGTAPLGRIHSAPYLSFLESAWDEWSKLHGEIDAMPLNWLVRGLRQKEPRYIDGRIAFYAGDAGTPITAGTWRAATSSANVALTGVDIMQAGERTAFSLCRPPGHHASADVYNGYCFLNNAAIAAQAWRDAGADRVTILDVDYHHGNGTQAIFYDRGDVQVVSIHADPMEEYPYFLGHADERGVGAGEGANLNLPLPFGTDYARFGEALDTACAAVADFGPDVVVLSLGADTYKDDPISKFKLESDDFNRIGERIAGLALPTHFVMEGGYAVDALGVNVCNVLTAFEGALD
ncbi:histone deacetylase family protein [Fodinicurvata sp. EGI_FJ10296]|uniref:histone deacetylase family protein n=1 Tax=Fodinicurvata sp. EGI_FJ10296 TaxID=3231908 RepID=UPI0034514B45